MFCGSPVNLAPTQHPRLSGLSGDARGAAGQNEEALRLTVLTGLLLNATCPG